MTMPATLVGDVVELHRWSLERLDDLMAAIETSLAELRPWMPWAQTMPTRAAERAVVEEAVAKFDGGDDFAYFVVEPHTGEIVGCAGLHPKRAGLAEIGYWIRSDRHRRGYATEAARLLTDAAFEHLDGVDTVAICMDEANEASAGVPPKLGYRLRDQQPWDRDLTPGDRGTLLTWTTGRSGYARMRT